MHRKLRGKDAVWEELKEDVVYKVGRKGEREGMRGNSKMHRKLRGKDAVWEEVKEDVVYKVGREGGREGGRGWCLLDLHILHKPSEIFSK